MQQNQDGSFPAADKLVTVAKYYDFDGWFINQETAGGNAEDAKKMQEFIKYFQNRKSEGMQIMWYDAMSKDGSISWQNELTGNNEMFLQLEKPNQIHGRQKLFHSENIMERRLPLFH